MDSNLETQINNSFSGKKKKSWPMCISMILKLINPNKSYFSTKKIVLLGQTQKDKSTVFIFS